MNLDYQLAKITKSYQATGQPLTSFQLIAKLYEQFLPFVFMTYLSIEAKQLKRVFSTNKAYPIDNYEPLVQSSWSEILIDKQEPIFLADDEALIKELSSDYELIKKLGAGSCLNIPVIFNANTVGIVNLCAKANAYDQKQIKQAQLIANTLAPILLNLPKLKEL